MTLHRFLLMAFLLAGAVASTAQTANAFRDYVPPVVTITASPSKLEPSDGRMVPVVVSGKITDALSGVDPATATYRVWDEYGQVEPHGHLTLQADGSYEVRILLQAMSRKSDRNGRLYTITVKANDKAKNLGWAHAPVRVAPGTENEEAKPHN